MNKIFIGITVILAAILGVLLFTTLETKESGSPMNIVQPHKPVGQVTPTQAIVKKLPVKETAFVTGAVTPTPTALPVKEILLQSYAVADAITSVSSNELVQWSNKDTTPVHLTISMAQNTVEESIQPGRSLKLQFPAGVTVNYKGLYPNGKNVSGSFSVN